MTKLRKGFTLLEAIVTIAILSVGFALTGVVVSQLVRIQDSATSVANNESVFQSTDSLIGQFVSFVSVDTPLLKFEENGSSPTGVVYVATQYSKESAPVSSVSFSLQYSAENKTLSVASSVISGEPNDYLKKSDWKSVKGISALTFELDDSIHFLTADVSLGEKASRRFCYVLRT